MKAPLFVTWPFLNGRTCSEPLPTLRAVVKEAVSVAIWSWDCPDDDKIEIVDSESKSVVDQKRLIGIIERMKKRKGIVTTTFVIDAATLVF